MTALAKREGTHPSTVNRWITKGILAPDPAGPGNLLIRLNAVRYPSGWRVREQDVADFKADLTRCHRAAVEAVAPMVGPHHGAAYTRRADAAAEANRKRLGG